jgi:hypothetical protein
MEGNDLLGLFVTPRLWNAERSPEIYYNALVESFPDNSSFNKACAHIVKHNRYFPTVNELIQAVPGNDSPKSTIAPRITSEALPGKKRNPDELKAAYEISQSRGVENMGDTVREMLDGYPDLDKPQGLVETKSCYVWLGKQFGQCPFGSVAGKFEHDAAIPKIAHYFNVSQDFAKKWVYLDLSGKFDRLKMNA